jgi:hypothetical protein
LDILHEFLSQIGEIRFIRAAYTDENAEIRGAYVEFSEQPSIPKVLSINGFQFFGRALLYVKIKIRKTINFILELIMQHRVLLNQQLFEE